MPDAVKKSDWKPWVFAGVGLAAGFVLALVAVVMVMPGMMIVTQASTMGFDETVAAIEAGIPEAGWASPGTLDLNKSMSKHGVEFGPQVRVIQMCQPDYARRVLEGNRDLSSLMPCGVAVWQGDDGKTYVSKMNTAVMGRMFGGAVAEVMGKHVSSETHAILSKVTE